MASRKEWMQEAKVCAQVAVRAASEARQALIDARRASVYAAEPDFVTYLQKALDASRDLPQMMQDVINVMDGGEPWYAKGKLNPPKDIDSAGEGSCGDEGETRDG